MMMWMTSGISQDEINKVGLGVPYYYYGCFEFRTDIDDSESALPTYMPIIA